MVCIFDPHPQAQMVFICPVGMALEIRIQFYLSTKLLTKTSIEILRIRETSEALNFQVLVLFSITEQPNNSTMKMHFKEFHLLSSQ